MATNQEKPPKSKKNFPKLAHHKTGQWYIRVPQVGCLYLGKNEKAASTEYERLKLVYEETGEYPKKKRGRRVSASLSGCRTDLPAKSPFTIRRRDSGDYYRVWVPTLKKTIDYGNVKEGHDRALEEYHRDLPSFLKGIDPHGIKKPQSSEFSVGLLCDEYMKHQNRNLEKGKLVERSVEDNQRAVDRVRDFFGDDREIESILPNDYRDFLDNFDDGSRSPTTLGNIVRDTKSIFNYGGKNILRKAIFYGDDFVKPDGRQVARYAQDHPEKSTHKFYEREEILAILEVAPVNWKAAILLGINAAIGNSDLSNIKFEDVNLDGEFLRGLRQKNFRDRGAWLWPETREALREHLEWRKKRTNVKLEAEDYVFVTKYGNRMSKDSAVSSGFTKAVESHSTVECKKGRSFYALRHTFNTVGRDSIDIEAVKHVMGHLDHKDTGAKFYTHGISDKRLQRLGHYVREWLFQKGESPFDFGELCPWTHAA
ncbi:MAG: site-specific integrase [Planctomycetes bacterium]|nr:site-specific integrase [Planctomycetota bacterium]